MHHFDIRAQLGPVCFFEVRGEKRGDEDNLKRGRASSFFQLKSCLFEQVGRRKRSPLSSPLFLSFLSLSLPLSSGGNGRQRRLR